MLCGCRNGHTQQLRATNPHDRPSSEQSAVDIYQAELDYRTARAHNDTKTYCSFNTHTHRASSHPSNLGSASMV